MSSTDSSNLARVLAHKEDWQGLKTITARFGTRR